MVAAEEMVRRGWVWVFVGAHPPSRELAGFCYDVSPPVEIPPKRLYSIPPTRNHPQKTCQDAKTTSLYLMTGCAWNIRYHSGEPCLSREEITGIFPTDALCLYGTGEPERIRRRLTSRLLNVSCGRVLIGTCCRLLYRPGRLSGMG
jgi:hypothetical protein